MRPPIQELVSDADWTQLRRQCAPEADRGSTLVVHTPSAAAHVRRIFPDLPESGHWEIRQEPQWEEFRRFEPGPKSGPALVIGVGGGAALDAAKVAAHWGRAFRTAEELKRILEDGGRLTAGVRAPLLLAPTLASSGSESSRGAIVGVGAIKIGLRGDSVQGDVVVHDRRLWVGLSMERQRHFAFDVFAHLLETAISLRRTDETVAHASQGADRLFHWMFTRGADPAAYSEAMHASYHAGLCLATSGTCLPHRLQYVVGPHTATTHVDGIWMLSPRWMAGLEATAPQRAADVAKLLGAERHGYSNLPALFGAVHVQAGHGVPRDRFRWTSGETPKLVHRVSGDLAADPSFVDTTTLTHLLSPFAHD